MMQKYISMETNLSKPLLSFYSDLLLELQGETKFFILPYFLDGNFIYQLKVSNRNIKTSYGMCSKITIKTPERRQYFYC